jgi:phage terminase small subunit
MNRALTDAEETFVLTCARYVIDTYDDLLQCAEDAAMTERQMLDALHNKEMIRRLRSSQVNLLKLPEFALSDKDFAFVTQYIMDFDQKAAAERLGYQQPVQAADRFMKKPGVQMELLRRRESIEKRAKVTVDRVLEEYARIAFSDLTDFVTYENGRVVVNNTNEVDGAILEELSEGPNGVKIKLHSKMKALEMLAKYVGVNREKIELSGPEGKDLIDTNPLAALVGKLDMITKNKENVEKESKS